MSFSDAESSKYAISNDQIPPELEKVTNDYVALLSGEVKKTLDFFANNFSKEKITSIILSGGSCRVPKLVESMEDTIGIDVVHSDPFKNISINYKTFDPDYILDIASKMCVAMGLAIRGASEG